MTIAIDFDGTIVEHRYPEIGREIPFAIETLKRLIKDGHKLILWTVREGKLLQEAVDWCSAKGVHFYKVNRYWDESDEEEYTSSTSGNHKYSRKIKADLFIDDRNIGGLPEWTAIYDIISKRISYEQYLREQVKEEKPAKPSFWSRFK
ncbi:BT0820 family HAD-type phosphatase [Alloprevotella tannerae]|mgnify:FL=1|jgi:hypothetical protein|uniref:BT0820 family HAD-type phosphatase n=1 Tax=Alloprevotella tannerae TaxID=76122 RepID=UPI0025CC641F|nr:hypothetical protein [Alloprevotella tannerae]